MGVTEEDDNPGPNGHNIQKQQSEDDNSTPEEQGINTGMDVTEQQEDDIPNANAVQENGSNTSTEPRHTPSNVRIALAGGKKNQSGLREQHEFWDNEELPEINSDFQTQIQEDDDQFEHAEQESSFLPEEMTHDGDKQEVNLTIPKEEEEDLEYYNQKPQNIPKEKEFDFRYNGIDVETGRPYYYASPQ